MAQEFTSILGQILLFLFISKPIVYLSHTTPFWYISRCSYILTVCMFRFLWSWSPNHCFMKRYRLNKQEPILLYIELKQTPPVGRHSETLTKAKIVNFRFLHDPTKYLPTHAILAWGQHMWLLPLSKIKGDETKRGGVKREEKVNNVSSLLDWEIFISFALFTLPPWLP